MTMKRSMPPGVIIPEPPYPELREAVDWLCRAFGFTERLRIGNHRAQFSFGRGSIVLTQRSGGSSASCAVMVRLDEIDEHYEHAKQSKDFSA